MTVSTRFTLRRTAQTGSTAASPAFNSRVRRARTWGCRTPMRINGGQSRRFVLLETVQGTVLLGNFKLVGALGQVVLPDFRIEQLEFQEIGAKFLSDGSQMTLSFL